MSLDEVLLNLSQEMLDKGKITANCSKDLELGKMLGVSGNTVTIYRSREKDGKDTIPYKRIVNIAQEHGLDLNKIFDIKSNKKVKRG